MKSIFSAHTRLEHHEATKMTKKMSVVYSLSNKGNMPTELQNSISTLLNFISPSNVHVISTPPHIDKNLQTALTKQGVNLTFQENETPYFEMRPGKGGYYGEKLAKLSTIDAENVLLLDCDTQVLDHPQKLFEGDFEVSARVGSGYLEFDFNIWNRMFNYHGKTPIPMMNSGCVAFKEKSHIPISRAAIKLLKYYNWPIFHHKRHYDQYALSLASSGYRIKWMSQREHGFRWEYESKNCVVYHGAKRKPLRGIGVKIMEVVNYVT